MAISYQITIDCADATELVPFWCAALGYVPTPPPTGFSTWNDWYRSVGVPDDELNLDGDGADRICDPDGVGAFIWFQPVPEKKSVKNRLHLDIRVGFVDGEKLPYDRRRPLIDAKVDELVAMGATVLHRNDEPEWERYTATLADPEGNEFCVC